MSIDPVFLALPLRDAADAALAQAAELGATHADVRIHRLRTGMLRTRDGSVESSTDVAIVGLAVRVVWEGTWGFAAGPIVTADQGAQLARRAVGVARVSAPLNTDPVSLAAEPVHKDKTWISAYEIDPFDVSAEDRAELILSRDAKLLAADGVDHVNAALHIVKECTYYADLAGTTTTQQRIRTNYGHTVLHVGDKTFDDMTTIAAPVGRGWEWVTGAAGYDHEAEIAELPSLLMEKVAAPSVDPRKYDLVIDPSNLWLTIHESIGHATELDRALGYEANYAGTSFATPDKLGTLKYGSRLLNVTGDRQVQHGLATVAFDDDGVESQTWDLVKDGILVGYQTDRRIAKHVGLDRSNGCAYADSPSHIPIQRMANVSLAAAPDGPSTEQLIAGVEDGIYIVGDKSWSIDMQRYNFQFTGQRFYRIRHGQLDGMLRDVAYQATTTDFWGSMVAIGGPQTWVLGGAFNCGKAQPGQVAAVSHGCPTAVFEQINVLNAVAEGAA